MIAQIQYYLNQVDSKLSVVAPWTGWFHTGQNLAKCKHEFQVLSLSLDFVLKHCIIILKSKDKNKLQRIYPLGILHSNRKRDNTKTLLNKKVECNTVCMMQYSQIDIFLFYTHIHNIYVTYIYIYIYRREHEQPREGTWGLEFLLYVHSKNFLNFYNPHVLL